MTVSELVAYIEAQKTVETSLGLHRMRALMAALGDPQKAYACTHAALKRMGAVDGRDFELCVAPVNAMERFMTF